MLLPVDNFLRLWDLKQKKMPVKEYVPNTCIQLKVKPKLDEI